MIKGRLRVLDLVFTISVKPEDQQPFGCRAAGFDCGPMSGFDKEQVDATFFAGTRIKSNFLINIGYGDPSKLYPRGPRLAFDEMSKIP